MSEPELGAEWRDVEIVSKFLNITPRRVQQLAVDGVIPRGERGKYHLVGAIRGYIKFLQERIEARAGEDGGLHDERTRLARLQSEDLELRLAERRGQLVNATQYEAAVGLAVMAARAELLTRDDKLKAELDALYGIDIDLSILNEHTRSALSQLARYDAGSTGVDQAGVGTVGAARGDDHHRVGEDT